MKKDMAEVAKPQNCLIDTDKAVFGRKDAADETLSKLCIFLFSFFSSQCSFSSDNYKSTISTKGLSEFKRIEFGGLENE